MGVALRYKLVLFSSGIKNFNFFQNVIYTFTIRLSLMLFVKTNMKIGIIIGRIGGVDGVALETEKWIMVLERLGHEVYVASGEFEYWKMDDQKHFQLPILSFFSPECEKEQKKAFFEPDQKPDSILDFIEHNANVIADTLESWILKHKIDIILSENASALPCHLSMGVGIKKLVKRTGLPTVTHNHDFHWERGDRYVSKHQEINSFVDDHFPLLLDNVKQSVINTFGVETFKTRFNLDSTLVPNVMNFDRPYAIPSHKNSSFLRDLGVKNNEIALLQVTRIVRRKGIETAIDLVHQLGDKNIKLIITGNHNDDEYNEYYDELVAQIQDLNLSNQVVFGSHMVKDHKDLSDVYAHGRACTYFSTYEGFGNAFVEAVLAKKPIFVNNYKPVYMQDIGCKGFKTVMIEDNFLSEEKVKNMADVIYNPTLCKDIGEYNFQLGKKYFSFQVLEEKLEALFTF